MKKIKYPWLLILLSAIIISLSVGYCLGRTSMKQDLQDAEDMALFTGLVNAQMQQQIKEYNQQIDSLEHITRQFEIQ